MTKRFEQKVAIVTAGGSGIGAATATALARAGALVMVADISGRRAEAVAQAICQEAGHPPGDLHDQCDCVVALCAPESVERPRRLPQRRGHCEALYMGLQQVAKKWTQPIRDWKAVLNQFVILFGDRVPV
jgi:NAD(P)-dependent dehydrogenase (short-subunit alcohol dehydrogenase family)